MADVTPSPASSVGCPSLPSLPGPPSYRKKNLSRQFPKEVYLRSDLPCHTQLCDSPTCRDITCSISGLGTVVEHAGVLSPDATHYVIPSYHALSRFPDVFGRSRLIHFLLLRTHAMQCSKVVERRMGEMLADGASQRRVAFFENEHHTSTATRQRSSETTAQRHERAERRAAKYFVQHLQGRKPIILIEEKPAPDQECAAESASSTPSPVYPRTTGGLIIHSMSSYLRWLQTQTIATSPDTTHALGDEDEPTRLLSLYESLLESERNKLRAKSAQAEAAMQLESMLAEIKIDWKRHVSEEGAKGHDGDDDHVRPSSVTVSVPGGISGADSEFEPHLPLSLALEAVSRGLLFRGHIKVNKYHAQSDARLDLGGRLLDAVSGVLVDSSVDSSGSDRVGDIFVSGTADRNRAIDGDEVIVQLLPASMWKAPTARKMLSMKGDRDRADGEEEDPVGSAGSPSERLVPTGRVVAIIQRHLRPYVCTLQLESAGGEFSLVVPMNECIPKIRIRTHQVSALAQQRLLVQIDEWDVNSRYPSGVYLRSLGTIGDLETGVRCLLHEFEISHPPFSLNMLRSLPSRDSQPDAKDRKYKVGSGWHSRGAPTPFSWSIPPAAMVGRRDLRETHRDCVCSIDPIGCEDIDDALSCRTLPNGRIEIGVHIADVCYFVGEDSLLSQEAARRGTSVYLVDRRLDMLPSVLSADLCSLRGGCERLCVSVMWEFDPQTGEVVNTWYGRTAIYNSFALSYEEAQWIVDTQGGTRPPPTLPETHPDYHLTLEERYDAAPSSSLTPAERLSLLPRITRLLLLGRSLRERRLAVGALELESLNIKFRLDSSHRILGVQAEADLEVHSTIAEWMVFANSTVAYHIYRVFPKSALLRHHPYPAASRFEKMKEMARQLGVDIDVTSNKSLADSLARAEQIVRAREFATISSSATALLTGGASDAIDQNQSKSWVVKLLKEMVARAMSEAQYFSTGSVDHVRDFFHYGLSADYYTHFTSPIRRYADIIVHRQLLAVIAVETREKEEKKAAQRALKAAARGESSSLVPVAGAAHSSTAGDIAPFTNDTLSQLAHHLNAKNRNAKIAGSESQSLFLACYLAGDPSVRATRDATSTGAATPTPTTRVERCEGLIVSMRANGFIVLLPRYHVKGAMLLLDRDGRANLAHPLQQAFDQEEESRAQRPLAPKAALSMNDALQEMTLTLSSALPAPTGAPADVSPLPLRQVFHLFDPIVVDVSLRPNLSRYRTPKPVFTLVWHANDALTTSQKKSAMRQVAAKPTDHAKQADSRAGADADTASPFYAGPQAPAGARKAKATPAAASSLYHFLRSAAASAPPTRRAKPDTPSNAGVDRKLQSRLEARVKTRHSGALGGRLLFTPGGVLPTEMLKSTMMQAADEEGEYDEEY